MTFIYIHGFNSKGNPNSPKVKSLSKLGNVVTLDYDSFASYEDIYDHLTTSLSGLNLDSNRVCLVGTSLGGFWAAEMSVFFGYRAILINPSITPRKTMKAHLGKSLTNYQTGEIRRLSPKVSKTYPNAPQSGNFLVLLDTADDVIDPYSTMEYLDGNMQVVFQGGSHRFDHMNESLDYIRLWISSS